MITPSPRSSELREALSRLHAELASTERIGSSLQPPLREVRADIERLLSGPEKVARPVNLAPHRLEALAIEFDAEHPQLAATLRQLTELLGGAGL